jgi:hypothetical protein
VDAAAALRRLGVAIDTSSSHVILRGIAERRREVTGKHLVVLGITLAFALLGSSVASSSASSPKAEPLPDWGGSLNPPVFYPGQVGKFRYWVANVNADELRITLKQVSPQLRLAGKGNPPYRLINGNPTWILRYPRNKRGHRIVTIPIRASSTARVGATYCITVLTTGRRGTQSAGHTMKSCAKVYRTTG